MSLDPDKLKILDSFPEISANATKALDMLNQDPVDFNKLDLMFKTEIGLSTRLLRIANSPFYGVSREIVSLRDAFVVLGVYSVRNIVMTAAVSNAVQADNNSPIANDELWLHSIAVSCAAKKLAKQLAPAESESAFMAGLLHEVGRMALNSHMSEEYQRVVELAQSQQIALGEAERQILGFAHNELGASLIEKWKLPEFLEEAIQHYYQPKVEGTLLPKVIHIANILTYRIGFGKNIEIVEPQLEQAVLDSIGLEMDVLLEQKDELLDMINEAKAIMD